MIVFIILFAVVSLPFVIWILSPRIPALNKDQRIKRSVFAGIIVVIFITSPALFYGFLNVHKFIKITNSSIDISVISNLCLGFVCVFFWGIVAAWSTYYRSKYVDKHLQESLEKLKKIVEKNDKLQK